MNKEQYLKALRLNLRNMPKAELEDILQYYEEYFTDAGVENESKVIEELGNPMALAKQLRAEAVLENMENEKNTKKTGENRISTIWILIAAVCTSPIWFPLGIVLAVVVFSLVIAVFSVLFALGIATVSLVAAGIMCIIIGIIAITSSVANGILAVGIGIITMGGGFLLTAIVLLIIELVYRVIVSICRILLRKKGDRNE